MTDPETPAESGAPDSHALARAETDAAAEAEAAEAEAGEAPAVPGEPPAQDATDELDDVLTSNDYTVAFSPRQVAVGLAIVAGLIAVVAARRRGRTKTGEGR